LDKITAIEDAAWSLLEGNISDAALVIKSNYPFSRLDSTKRKFTDTQKMEQFVRDGFIDRYSGQKLINPGILKVLSYYLPKDFPYHAHWKMEECHFAYWEFVPTVDHIYPVALGGADTTENWASTSMLHNSIKNAWTLEQLRWKLYDSGNFQDWDGMTDLFIRLVEANESLLADPYIKKWYKLSKKAVEDEFWRAYSFSRYQKTKIENDRKCGCFSCLRIFSPGKITEWGMETEDGDEVTAICPYCGLDAVIGEYSGFRINAKFLKKMNERCFSSVMR